ncbi:MAG: AAA family ATPase [bacterium]|nr:AAA family ATPase [bacterium]
MEYRFNDCILNAERQELQRHGDSVHLQSRAFQTLLYLIARRDRVVPKDELFAQLWSERCVSDSVLNTCIKTIRRAVGDSGREQQVIKTLHGRGYRFVATLLEDSTSAEDSVPHPAVDRDQVPRQHQLAAASQDSGTTASFTREYKNVTMLSCVLADMERLDSQLESEVMDDLMQRFIKRVRTIMDRHQGTITQWLGDGFAALFGAPRAYEDHARQAVLAALELQQQMLDDYRNTDFRSPALPCIGIHSGSVVVGVLEQEPAMLYTPLCATTQLAAQLQKEATAGDVLISEATHRLLAGEIKAVSLVPGKQAPACYRVLEAEKNRAGVLQARHRTPFIGRNRELGILHERLVNADEGRGQIVAIVGEPGIGKSRLVREFRRSLTGAYDFYQGNCLSHANTHPFFPVLELVRQYCAIDPSENAFTAVTKLRARLQAAGLEDDHAVPLLAQLLGLDVPNDSGNGSLQQLSPYARREHSIRCLCRLMLSPGIPDPGNGGCRIILLEDLHWSDASSQTWLDRLSAQLATSRTLLVLTYRPGCQSGWLEHSWVSKLALPPLTHQASTRLMNAVAKTLSLPAAVADNIVTKAEGNPFFLEELTWNLSDRSGERGGIPDTVQDVLAARIDRLPPGAKQLLQTAAVIGARIPARLLRTVSEQDQDALESDLQKLQAAEFIFESFASPETVFQFKHILTQEVAYQSLLQSTKMALHRKIAAALQTHFTTEISSQPELLALHFTGAADYATAIDCWLRAGRRAYQRSANLEATEYLNQGLALLPQLPDDVTRTERELNLLLTLGPAQMAVQGYAAPQVGQTWRRAQDLCLNLDNQTALFRVLLGLWNFNWVSGHLEQAISTAEQLLALAEQSGNPTGNNMRRLRAHAAMGETLLHAGKPVVAQQHLEQGLALFPDQPARHSHATGIPSVACLAYSAWTRWHLGYSDQALRDAQQALALAEELRHPLSLAIALSLLAELHQFRLEPSATLGFSKRAIALSKEQGFPFWESTALVLQGWAQTLLGQTSVGLSSVQQGIQVFRATGAQVQLSSWFGLLAEVHAAANRPEQGLVAIDQALHWVQQTNERYYEPEIQRLHARLLRQAKPAEYGLAEQALRCSIAGAQSQGALTRELRASMDLAELRRDQGHKLVVDKLVQPLYSRYTEGFDTPDLQRARAMLDPVSGGNRKLTGNRR